MDPIRLLNGLLICYGFASLMDHGEEKTECIGTNIVVMRDGRLFVMLRPA